MHQLGRVALVLEGVIEDGVVHADQGASSAEAIRCAERTIYTAFAF